MTMAAGSGNRTNRSKSTMQYGRSGGGGGSSYSSSHRHRRRSSSRMNLRPFVPPKRSTFAARRVEADLEVWKCHYLARSKHWAVHSVRSANKQREFDTRKAAVTGPSFKVPPDHSRRGQPSADPREEPAAGGLRGERFHGLQGLRHCGGADSEGHQAAAGAGGQGKPSPAVAAANASHGNGAEVGGGSGDVGFGEDGGGRATGEGRRRASLVWARKGRR